MILILGKFPNKDHIRYWGRNKVQDTLETSKGFTGIEMLVRKYRAVTFSCRSGQSDTLGRVGQILIPLSLILSHPIHIWIKPTAHWLNHSCFIVTDGNMGGWMCSLHVLGKCKELINFHMFRKYLVSTKGRPGIVHYHWHKGRQLFIWETQLYK